MNGRTFIAAFVAAIGAFALGWLFYGIILASFMKANMVSVPGVTREMPIFWSIFLAQLVSGFLYSWILQSLNITTFSKGFVKTAGIGFLFALSIDLYFYSSMDMFRGITGYIVDVITSTLIAACMGGIAGFILGFGKKE